MDRSAQAQLARVSAAARSAVRVERSVPDGGNSPGLERALRRLSTGTSPRGTRHGKTDMDDAAAVSAELITSSLAGSDPGCCRDGAGGKGGRPPDVGRGGSDASAASSGVLERLRCGPSMPEGLLMLAADTLRGSVLLPSPSPSRSRPLRRPSTRNLRGGSVAVPLSSEPDASDAATDGSRATMGSWLNEFSRERKERLESERECAIRARESPSTTSVEDSLIRSSCAAVFRASAAAESTPAHTAAHRPPPNPTPPPGTVSGEAMWPGAHVCSAAPQHYCGAALAPDGLLVDRANCTLRPRLRGLPC